MLVIVCCNRLICNILFFSRLFLDHVAAEKGVSFFPEQKRPTKTKMRLDGKHERELLSVYDKVVIFVRFLF